MRSGLATRGIWHRYRETRFSSPSRLLWSMASSRISGRALPASIRNDSFQRFLKNRLTKRSNSGEDGFFYFSGGPLVGGLDEGGEDGAAEGALVVRALGMPLDGEDEVAV